MSLTEDQILSLAPDESSKKSGKELANPSKWVTKGASESAIWGECQGSGSKPYQTQIDLSKIAFKCSCPSRKFPCKHGIALGLLYARQPGTFGTEQPPWVTEWISKRAEKEDKKTEKSEKPVDEKAQAKRQQAREQKVSEGIEELLRWIRDLIQNGIINLPEKSYQFWEGMAKRMIDAQAPGLAGMVRQLASVNFFEEGWQSHFMDRLLNLYLTAKGYQNKENLDPVLMDDIRSLVGFTTNQDELKSAKGIQDTWLVLGKRVTEEDNLTVERHWLYGTSTGKYALVLQFTIRGQGTQMLLSPGMYLDAELVYYPSIEPLRALIKTQASGRKADIKQLYQGWKQVAERETEICSGFPVQNDRPYLVHQILPVHYNGQWWLRDSNHDLVILKNRSTMFWKLLALSGGEPLNMALIGKEKYFEPIGVWHQEQYKAL